MRKLYCIVILNSLMTIALSIVVFISVGWVEIAVFSALFLGCLVLAIVGVFVHTFITFDRNEGNEIEIVDYAEDFVVPKTKPISREDQMWLNEEGVWREEGE